jgi:hypothetical protein
MEITFILEVEHMNKEQINFLLQAGYSIAEIMQMQPASAADPAPTPAADPEPTPAPAADPEPAADPTTTALLTAVPQLTQAVQLGNIRGTGFPAPQPDRTVEDILGEIINPPTYQPKH